MAIIGNLRRRYRKKGAKIMYVTNTGNAVIMVLTMVVCYALVFFICNKLFDLLDYQCCVYSMITALVVGLFFIVTVPNIYDSENISEIKYIEKYDCTGYAISDNYSEWVDENGVYHNSKETMFVKHNENTAENGLWKAYITYETKYFFYIISESEEKMIMVLDEN